MMLVFRAWTIPDVNVFIFGALSLIFLLPPTISTSVEDSLFKRLRILNGEPRIWYEESTVYEPSPSAAKTVTIRTVTESQPEELVTQTVSHLARFIGQLNIGHDDLRSMITRLFEHRRCPDDSVPCNNGRQCYQKLRMCDGFPNCIDLSDEENCENKSCPLATMEKCADGKQCILASDICNGEVNCLDESDEFYCDTDDCADDPCDNGGTCNDMVNDYNCSCLPGFIGIKCEIALCPEGNLICMEGSTCYPSSWRCDGLLDCPDGSDEYNCSTFECEPGQMKCANDKQCILPDWLCDNYTHCSDGSDETACDHDPFNMYLGETDVFWDFCHDLNGTRCLHESVCFFSHQECDRYTACPNHHDEWFCCPEGQVRCKTVDKCYSIFGMCNGEYDCPDQSDEECDFGDYL